MRKAILTCSLVSLGAALPLAAGAQTVQPVLTNAAGASQSVPMTLNSEQRSHYRALFAAIDEQRWPEVVALLDTGPDRAFNDYARAEYFLAANSPKAELDPIMAVLTRQPDLPQAAQLARLAEKRGAMSLPLLPVEQKFSYLGESPRRVFNLPTTPDPVAATVSGQILDRIKNDDPAAAESILNGVFSQLSPAALTEWQYRIAWSYYIENDNGNARRLADMAERGSGNWVAQAHWAGGLAAWRQGDFASAVTKFSRIPSLTDDQEMQAAGHYWAARTYVASGQPKEAGSRLKSAARLGETFYGLLANEALGVATPWYTSASENKANDWQRIQNKPNVHIAMALKEIGQDTRTDTILRHQARIGQSSDYLALVALARKLNLPSTQMFLAHYGPPGQRPDQYARYPAPDWHPEGGWRVDRSLVYAHALQESQFRTSVVSPAGAYGLMQVRPGTARDIAESRGIALLTSDLAKPSVNIEYGQSYMEYLRDNGATGGLLPKVIAAYNAGPNPVARWNSEISDNGDPLLFIESIPYWETRGYVGIVLRNYWMYQRQAGEESRSMVDIAQGRWPVFPSKSAKGTARISNNPNATGISE